MDAGPFEIDEDYVSILKIADFPSGLPAPMFYSGD